MTTWFDLEAEAWAIEGGTVQSSSADDCFVVTATYGSPLAAEVRVFRAFRNRLLRRSARGRAMIGWYENVGPGLARWIDRSPGARSFVRSFLLDPAARVVRYTQFWWDSNQEELP